MTSGKTVGSIETWEPEDKSFSKHMISEGQGDLTPNDGAVCRVNVSLVDELDVRDEVLGSYKLNETTEVTIGEGDTHLSELLDKVLCSMKEKEACYIKAKVDFEGKKIDEFLNKKGQPKFNIILQSFDRAAERDDLEADEILERAQHHKDKGSELFRSKNITFAVKRYKKASQLIKSVVDIDQLPESLQNQCELLNCQCYLNLAACYLNKEQYEPALSASKLALDIDESNLKGYYRKGQALFKLGRHQDAVEAFQKVLSLEPHNAPAQKELGKAQAAIKKEKQMYQKMFS